jgi:hypothetical protein
MRWQRGPRAVCFKASAVKHRETLRQNANFAKDSIVLRSFKGCVQK